MGDSHERPSVAVLPVAIRDMVLVRPMNHESGICGPHSSQGGQHNQQRAEAETHAPILPQPSLQPLHQPQHVTDREAVHSGSGLI
jgi:hypothetical protein